MWGKLVSDSALTQITEAIASPAMFLARCVSAIQNLAPRCRQTKSPVPSGVRKSQQNGQAKSCRQDLAWPFCCDFLTPEGTGDLVWRQRGAKFWIALTHLAKNIAGDAIASVI